MMIHKLRCFKEFADCLLKQQMCDTEEVNNRDKSLRWSALLQAASIISLTQQTICLLLHRSDKHLKCLHFYLSRVDLRLLNKWCFVSDCSKNDSSELRKHFSSHKTPHMCRHPPINSKQSPEDRMYMVKINFRASLFTPDLSSVHNRVEVEERALFPQRKWKKWAHVIWKRVEKKSTTHWREGRGTWGWGSDLTSVKWTTMNSTTSRTERVYVVDVCWKVSVNVQHGLFLQVSVLKRQIIHNTL